MTLHAHPRNPIPPDAVTGFVTTPDGVRLRFARWPALVATPRATVLVLQGRAEFMEKYLETVGDLLARGYAVATFDWRGQGGSGRLLPEPAKGHVRRFADYLVDLQTILAEVIEPNCPQPLYAIAHSTGGLVLLAMPLTLAIRFRRLVLLAPLLELGRRFPRQATVSRLSRSLDAAGLGSLWIPGGSRRSIHTRPFAGNPLTADERRYARNAAIVSASPELAIGSPTIRWLAESCRAMAAAARPEVAAGLPMPALLVSGLADEIVSARAVERFGRAMKTGGTITIAGARHELLQERDDCREQLWAAFDAFVPGSR